VCGLCGVLKHLQHILQVFQLPTILAHPWFERLVSCPHSITHQTCHIILHAVCFVLFAFSGVPAAHHSSAPMV
jgi:hypothetical protein